MKFWSKRLLSGRKKVDFVPAHLAPGAGRSDWAHDLAISRRESAKMSKKNEKIENFSGKIRVKIWSFGVEIQPNFWVWSRKNAKKKIGFCTGAHWAGYADWAYDLAISGQGRCKMSKNCGFSSKKVVTWRGKTESERPGPGTSGPGTKSTFFLPESNLVDHNFTPEV